MKRISGALGDFLYSSGSISSSITAQFFSTFIIFFYVDTLKLSPVWVSVGMTLYGVWNAINDPLFGQLSDRTKSRWGRRVPWVLFGTIPFALAFWLVWVPPFRGADQQGLLFAYFLGAIFLYDTLYTVVILNWTALFPEMYPDLKRRASISALRQALSILGMILGTALPPMLTGALGWGTTAAIFAVITALFLGLSVLGSHERPELAEAAGLPIREALKHTLANRSFLTFVFTSMLVQFTFVTLTGAIPFYTKYVLKLSDFYTTVLLAAIFLAALPMVAVWSKLTARWGARKAMLTAIVIYGACLIPFWFATNVVGGVATAVLVALGLAGLLILFDIFIADVSDEDELRTGVRREGMYFGVHGFMIRLGISLQAIMMGQVLSRTGYDANLAVQPASAAMGIRLLMTVVPIAALLLALVCVYFYPLHGARLAEVRRLVAERHAASQKASSAG